MVRKGQKQEESAETSQKTNDHTNYGPEEWMSQGAPYIDVQLLTPNEYSRPQLPLNGADYIAIHYTANPGATAQNNRDYFENLSISHEAKVSSHFVVGLEGEVIQCIPTSEMSYATNSRNVDSISIECCHKDDTGVFEQETYDSVVKLAAWLCARFGLTSEQVIRHYDVTGKECPKYYVDHPDAWGADEGGYQCTDHNRSGLDGDFLTRSTDYIHKFAYAGIATSNYKSYCLLVTFREVFFVNKVHRKPENLSAKSCECMISVHREDWSLRDQ